MGVGVPTAGAPTFSAAQARALTWSTHTVSFQMPREVKKLAQSQTAGLDSGDLILSRPELVTLFCHQCQGRKVVVQCFIPAPCSPLSKFWVGSAW